MGNFDRLAQSNDPWDIEGTGAAPVLVATTFELRRHAHSGPLASQVQGADALGPAEFVGRQGEQVDATLVNIDRQLGDRLGGIGVKQRSMLAAKGADLCHRMQYTQLVVSGHQRDQARPTLQRLAELLKVQVPKLIHAQARNLEPLARFQ